MNKSAWFWGQVSKGGPTSGNYGHKGRPGIKGGSMPGGGHGAIGAGFGSGVDTLDFIKNYRQQKKPKAKGSELQKVERELLAAYQETKEIEREKEKVEEDYWIEDKIKTPEYEKEMGKLNALHEENAKKVNALQKKRRELSKDTDRALYDQIKKSEEQIHRLEHERLVLFAEDGSEAFVKDGGEDSVSFTNDELSQFTDKIATHNHPRGWTYPDSDPRHAGNSFSREDIRLAIEHNMLEMRAVSPGATYSMKRPGAGWPSLDDTLYFIKSSESKVREVNWGKITNGEITPEEAEANHFHSLWTRFAESTGVEYTKVDRP